jgi:DNA gyrase/topoisomerase IV subunit B
MTRELKLTVNGESIPLDYFVEAFIDHTTRGMLESLEGTGDVITAKINIDDGTIKVTANGSEIPVNPFVTKILNSTIRGMVSVLKGVGKIDKLQLTID